MPSILVNNLHKEFRIYERPQNRLWEILLRRPQHKLYHALRDISFAVPDGKSLGIIGLNGAGKSTLLKLLAGILQPTSGEIVVCGQLAALLELGAGFHPDFSGRRNIYLNASLLGLTDDNIAALEQDIIAFSELEEFIDRPVKTYSSGMYVRLAFSIATMIQPDILVIDEALSVGDMGFQRKCVERMNRFRAEQKIMVFCSHSMFHIQELCDTAIWIDKGQVRELGDSDRVVGHYEDFCSSRKTYHNIAGGIASQSQLKNQSGNQHADSAAVALPDCRIRYLTIRDHAGQPVDVLEPLGSVTLEMEVEVLKDGIEGNFGFAFMKSAEEPVASFLTTELNGKEVEKGPFHSGDVFTVSLAVSPIAMRVGEFFVLGGLADKSGLLWYETRFSKQLSIRPNKGVGPVIMQSNWSVQRKPA